MSILHKSDKNNNGDSLHATLFSYTLVPYHREFYPLPTIQADRHRTLADKLIAIGIPVALVILPDLTLRVKTTRASALRTLIL